MAPTRRNSRSDRLASRGAPAHDGVPSDSRLPFIIAGLVIVAGVVGLVWLLGGSSAPVQSAAPLVAKDGTKQSPPAAHPVMGNHAPRAEIRTRIDPLTPWTVEYSGKFSEDFDANDQLSYAWDFGDGSVGTNAMGLKTYASDGGKTMTLTVTDRAGATGIARKTVTLDTVDVKRFRVSKVDPAVVVPGLRGTKVSAHIESFAQLESYWDAGERFNADRIDTSSRPRDYNYALRFQGYLKVETAGVYSFFLRSDDGSRLVLGGATVIVMDQMQASTSSGGVVFLPTGLIDFRVDYYQGDGDQELEVKWAGPDIESQVISKRYFWRDSN